jgi:hypothetical protein
MRVVGFIQEYKMTDFYWFCCDSGYSVSGDDFRGPSKGQRVELLSGGRNSIF